MDNVPKRVRLLKLGRFLLMCSSGSNSKKPSTSLLRNVVLSPYKTITPNFTTDGTVNAHIMAQLVR